MNVLSRLSRRLLTVLAAAVCLAVPASAQDAAGLRDRQTTAPPAGAMPEILQDIGLDQQLNAQVPLGLTFTDETGRTVELREYFGRRPVVLSLVYYECPMLCTQVLNGLERAMRVLEYSPGQEYEVVTVSFDPGETPALAAEKKAAYVQQLGRPGAAEGWHFLTGDERSVSALARAVGFRYAYNAEVDQYAHASGIMVLTPDGRLSHYFYGIEYSPRDLRLALVEAGRGAIGNPVDAVLLYCFHYDPASGKYSLAVMNLVRAAGLLTVAAIAGAIVALRRRERRSDPRGARA